MDLVEIKHGLEIRHVVVEKVIYEDQMLGNEHCLHLETSEMGPFT